MKTRTLVVSMALVAVSLGANAANPFLPLWEYIPDGEPYVFEDPDAPGKMRVYVYGSHDNLRDKYCGRDQVVWSAPVEDLNKWRFDGVIFRSLNGADGRRLSTSSSIPRRRAIRFAMSRTSCSRQNSIYALLLVRRGATDPL